jgi:hypothetical protein
MTLNPALHIKGAFTMPDENNTNSQGSALPLKVRCIVPCSGTWRSEFS